MANSGIDWTEADEKIVREIVDRGETYLQAQLASGIAADQRAITLAGMFIGTLTATSGATLAALYSNDFSDLVPAGVGASLFLFIASVACSLSARPVAFNFPGNQPENWYSSREGDLKNALGGEAENYQAHIESNHVTLQNNASMLRWGLGFALLSPVAAIVAMLLAAAWNCRLSSS